LGNLRSVQPPDLSLIFSALADPTRRAILARLSRGEAPVKELAKPFELSGPAITKHLKVLERAGLISRGRERQRRPCRLEARALEPALDWLEQYRAMWEAQLDRLGSYLETVTATPNVQSAKPPSSMPTLDAQTTRKVKGTRRD
jgi:DNA-binding transcriptional ArsR family regulator